MDHSFNYSTRQVLEELGLNSTKTLFRRRTDYKDRQSEKTKRFLKPGIHFRRKSPDSGQLVWNWEKTARAWDQAIKLSASHRDAEVQP